MEWEEVSDLAAVAADVDVLYQTRIQKERFLDRIEDYEAARGKFIINAALLKLMKPSSVIMHPLPRVDEVRTMASFPCARRACALCTKDTLAERWF